MDGTVIHVAAHGLSVLLLFVCDVMLGAGLNASILWSVNKRRLDIFLETTWLTCIPPIVCCIAMPVRYGSGLKPSQPRPPFGILPSGPAEVSNFDELGLIVKAYLQRDPAEHEHRHPSTQLLKRFHGHTSMTCPKWRPLEHLQGTQ